MKRFLIALGGIGLVSVFAYTQEIPTTLTVYDSQTEAVSQVTVNPHLTGLAGQPPENPTEKTDPFNWFPRQ